MNPAVVGPLVHRAPIPARRRQVLVLMAVCVLTTACQSTSIPGLNVRVRPTTSSPVVASIDRTGTRVEIECVADGEPVHGDTVWYRISRPSTGYVTNYYVRTDGNVLADTRRVEPRPYRTQETSCSPHRSPPPPHGLVRRGAAGG